MKSDLKIEKYSFGVGDRFAHQAEAQLRACMKAAAAGAEVVPVWNKSNREHLTIGSEPGSVRTAADAAVKALGWDKSYYVDADHVQLATVDRFVEVSDFFTIDVADSIGKPAGEAEVKSFADRHGELVGTLEVSGLEQPMETTREQVEEVARKYLLAVKEAGELYRHVAAKKGEGRFVTEVSMDETDSPQTPPELLIILAAMADEKIPAQTIAPKFTGRFNKGVDYVGEIEQFEREFNADLAVISYAIGRYGLPDNLKLSVHSGSDKFSIYPPIRRAMARFGAGLHIKTAGTSWLEELIGLAEAGGEGLALAKEVYVTALSQREALCAPYATVIDVDPSRLPAAEVVEGWSSEEYVSALRHDLGHPAFNPHFRQLLHVGYKVAAKLGQRYLKMLESCEEAVSRNVTDNLYERHLKPLFVG